MLTLIAKLSSHLVSRQNAIATDEKECEYPYIISVCRAESVQRAWGSNKQLACTWCNKGARKEGDLKPSPFFPVLMLHIDIEKNALQYSLEQQKVNLAGRFHGRLLHKI